MSELTPHNLNDRQRLFCEEYANIANASRAARLAGYSEKTAGQHGHDLLKNPKIRAEIERIRQERLADLGIDPHYVLRKLKTIADGEVTYETRDGEELVVPPKDSDRIKALELLGKHQGLWVERVKHEGEVTFTLDIPRPNPQGDTIIEGDTLELEEGTDE